MTKSALLDSISPGYKALASALTAAGLDPAKIASGEIKLADHIAAQAKAQAPDLPTAIEAATSDLQTRLTESQALVARHSSLVAALSAAGLKAKDGANLAEALAKADAATAPEILKQALADFSSIKAQEQLAQHHLGAPLPLAPAADPTKAKAADALTRAEFFALSPSERLNFSKRGGKLID